MAEKKKERTTAEQLLDWASSAFRKFTKSDETVAGEKRLETQWESLKAQRSQKEEEKEEAPKKRPLTQKEKDDIFYGRK